jgi:hypothetical protein
MIAAEFTFISRLRDDTNLKYLYSDGPTGKPDRPKKRNRKVNAKNIDKERTEK